ncbi:MAG TPA: Gfo/Idh/MocA family oxidoreductase [Candidatus Polarisedimenticolia bacterium]|nr:Gfo/Idh/MocA family oxidoreductase [Candidatus Polarisedimenticolia bacterium]
MKQSLFKSEAKTRREFLKTTALAAGAITFGMPAVVRGQNLNSKVSIAGIGITGKGRSDLDACSGENIVALCDVDRKRSQELIAKYPNAKFYADFRKMFDAIGKSIDAVNIATPDHTHALIASHAIRLGKHVYCQKPLTQTIYEARLLRDLAREHKVVTQMGNQGSAADGLRRAVEVIQAGVIGHAREVHVWTNRPIWPQGCPRPAGSDPVPADFDWDLWLGPAPARPFKKDTYHPFVWRGWVDFGTGALGDMACHTVNMPFRALQLGYPGTIEAECSDMNGETYPLSSKIRFDFPMRFSAKNDVIPASSLWWYDGGKPKADNPYRHDESCKPAKEITADVEAFRGEVPRSGCLIIGAKGQIFSPDDYGTEFFIKLTGEDKFRFYKNHPAAEAVPQSIPRNPSKSGDGQHSEWITAIKDTKPETCYSRFEIAASLTEIMLLGCVALRAGKKIEWDGPNMRATNAPEAKHFIKRHNRSGWSI